MKSYLVDVPVMLCVWTRPEVQEKTFQQIKKARPSKLYLVSDGPRNEREAILLEESRRVCEDIDWNCEVHKLYMTENQGMYSMILKQMDFVFSNEDRCIFLEDDVYPSESFFRFCEELLEKYKDDTRICAINGLNHRGKWRENEADYFFTLGNAIHGFAMWRRTYELHFQNNVFNNAILDRELRSYSSISKDDFITKSVIKSVDRYSKDPLAEGHLPAVEFYRSFINVSQSQLDIVPSVNLISNIGIEGAHASDYKLMPKKIKKMFFQTRYEVEFPLRHPEFMIRDKEYEKWFKPKRFEKAFLWVETVYLNFKYLSFDEFAKKIIRHFKKRKTIIEN